MSLSTVLAALVGTLTFHLLFHGKTRVGQVLRTDKRLNFKTTTPSWEPMHPIFTIPINFDGIEKAEKVCKAPCPNHGWP